LLAIGLSESGDLAPFYPLAAALGNPLAVLLALPLIVPLASARRWAWCTAAPANPRAFGGAVSAAVRAGGG